MTAPDLPAIRALLEGATPGPWTVEYDEYGEDGEIVRYPIGVGPFTGDFDNLGNGSRADADAAFIAAAPSIVAQLVAVVERVEGLAAAWEARGEHDMKFSKTIPDEDIAIVLLTEGASMVENARHIRNAIKGEGQ